MNDRGRRSGDHQEEDLVRVPPQAIEAEQSIIGELLLDNRCIAAVEKKLQPNHFYRSDHNMIYAKILEMYSNGTPADVVTVSEELDQVGDLQKCGGLAYLGTLAKNTPRTGFVDAYVQIVIDRFGLRRIADLGTDLNNSVFADDGKDSHELIDDAERRVLEIKAMSRRHNTSAITPFSDIIERSMHGIVERGNSGDRYPGISTGLRALDEITGGLQDSDLVILGGRPSMGKTSFAINMAESAAIAQRKSVAVFSVEMPETQLADRLLSSVARVDGMKIRRGDLNSAELGDVAKAAGRLEAAKIWIDDTSGITPNYVDEKCELIEQEHGLDMIVLDYAQLLDADGKHGNRNLEIGSITKACKGIAKKYNCPFVLLSQVNREVERRPDKRPMPRDLKDGGSIEQDADVIMFCYREEVYSEEDEDVVGKAEIVVRKQRNGALGTAHCAWIPEFTRYQNIEASDNIHEAVANTDLDKDMNQ